MGRRAAVEVLLERVNDLPHVPVVAALDLDPDDRFPVILRHEVPEIVRAVAVLKLDQALGYGPRRSRDSKIFLLAGEQLPMNGLHDVGQGIRLADDAGREQVLLQLGHVFQRLRRLENLSPLPFLVEEEHRLAPRILLRLRRLAGLRLSGRGKRLEQLLARLGCLGELAGFGAEFLEDRRCGLVHLLQLFRPGLHARQHAVDILRRALLGLWGFECEIRHVGSAEVRVQHLVRHADRVGGIEPFRRVVVDDDATDAPGRDQNQENDRGHDRLGPLVGQPAGAGKQPAEKGRAFVRAAPLNAAEVL